MQRVYRHLIAGSLSHMADTGRSNRLNSTTCCVSGCCCCPLAFTRPFHHTLLVGSKQNTEDDPVGGQSEAALHIGDAMT